MKELFIRNLIIAFGKFFDLMRVDMGITLRGHDNTTCCGHTMPPQETPAGAGVTPPPMPPQETPAGAGGKYPGLDTQGIPWDKRIHSGGGTKYKKRIDDDKPEGGWTLKKGVDINEVRRIVTELKTTAGAGVTPPPMPPQETVTELPTTWGELMRIIVQNGIDRTLVDSECAAAGAGSLTELQNNPALIPEVAVRIGIGA